MAGGLEIENEIAPVSAEAGDDVVALMARIQSEATEARKLADTRLGSLREALQPFLHHGQTAAPAAEIQGEANQLFQELAQALASPAGSPLHDLVELGRLPQKSGPAATVRRRLLAPQERFNLELLGRLSDLHGSLSQAQNFGLLVAVTGRLVGSVNVILQALADLEHAVESWDREETRWRAGVVAALEDLLEEVKELNKVAGLGHETPPAATVDDLKTLRQWAEEVTGTIMGYVRDQAAQVSSFTRQFPIELLQARTGQEETAARIMEHVTALAVRVNQAEASRDAAVSESEVLRTRVESLEKRLAQLESRPPAVAAAVPVPARSGPAPAPAASPAADTSAVPIGGPEFDFLVWEDLTRGAESAISEEQKKYLPWFRGMDAPVLDAGCGRGEFLELLKSEGVDAYGIDADPSMVAHCNAKELRVEQAELFDHLRALPDDSLGGLFLGQVVEHIPPAALRTLTDLAWAKLRPGAAVVMETINPTCLTTFSGAFYADPTHQKPVHPKALEYFLTASGFGPTEIIFSAPIPPGEKLAPVREEAPLDPAVKSVLLQVNGNFDRLNSVLYGYANYAAAARKPAR